MSHEQERADIETRFYNQWLTGSPAALRTPVGWTDQKWTPPTDEASVRIAVRHGSGNTASFGDPGSNLVRYAGAIMFQVFTPGGQGSKEANDLIDLIVPIFTNWRSGQILVRELRDPSVQNEAPWRVEAFHFPFQRDAFHG